MMGYFLENGWVQDATKSNAIRFEINGDNYDYVTHRIREVLDINIIKSDSGEFGCSNFLWYNILKEFGNKIIPEWVQDAPVHFIHEFLEGYKRAHGYTTKNDNLRFTIGSHNLALGLQRLYLKMGHIFSVKRQRFIS